MQACLPGIKGNGIGPAKIPLHRSIVSDSKIVQARQHQDRISRDNVIVFKNEWHALNSDMGYMPRHPWTTLISHVQAPHFRPEQRHVPALQVVDHRYAKAGTLHLFARNGNEAAEMEAVPKQGQVIEKIPFQKWNDVRNERRKMCMDIIFPSKDGVDAYSQRCRGYEQARTLLLCCRDTRNSCIVDLVRHVTIASRHTRTRCFGSTIYFPSLNLKVPHVYKAPRIPRSANWGARH